MDKITHKVRCEQWTNIIKECLASGMPKTTWCREHGISDKSFFYWQRILREEAYLTTLENTFPNEPFNSIGAFSTEQEQNTLLKRIQIKLKLNGRCQTVNSTPQVSIPCGNKNFFKSDSIVKHGEDLQPYLEVLL